MVRWSLTKGLKTPVLAPVRVQGVRQENRIIVTQQFRQESEQQDHIRAGHAIAALRDPNGIERFDLSDESASFSVVLATKRITAGRLPYTLLLFCTEREPRETEVALGFKIYDREEDESKIWLHPLDAFLTLLRRYGVPVQVGDETDLWIAKARIEISSKDKLVQARITDNRPFIMSAIIKLNNGYPRIADVRWAFALDAGRYRTDLRRRGR